MCVCEGWRNCAETSRNSVGSVQTLHLLVTQVLYYMLGAHECGRAMHWRTDPEGAEACCLGGARYTVTQCSLLYHACVCLGIEPDTVHCPLAGAFRACTARMPAHYDEDADWPQTNYYMRGIKEGDEERQGCRLFIGSNKTGGSWVEVGTDPMEYGTLLLVQFTPSHQLHFTESAAGSEGRAEKTFVRHIPFDNKGLTNMLLLEDGKKRGVRLAPLHPLPRQPIKCLHCQRVFGCPRMDARNWLQHLCHGVQKAAGRRGFVCRDCIASSASHQT